jgi:hypothetical protein
MFITMAKMTTITTTAENIMIVYRLFFCSFSFFFQMRSISTAYSGLCSSTNTWKLLALPFLDSLIDIFKISPAGL